jgi:hypothetical protein
MVQIPEYTRRDTFSSTERPKSGLQITDALARSASGSNGVDELRKVAKGAEVIADNMLQMKKEYDKARANECVNGYMKKANETINGYKKDRVGRLSDGVVSDFESWSEKYFNEAIGHSEDSSAKPLLENKEQITLAREMIDKLNLNYYMDLSSFQAKEQQKYADNEAVANITLLSAGLSAAQNDTQILSYMSLLNESIGGISQNKGQSEEHLSVQRIKIFSPSLKQNILSSVLSDPSLSMSKMENDLFRKNMEPSDYSEAEEKVLRAYVDRSADELSDYATYGGDLEKIITESMNRPFFKEKNVDMIAREIQEKAETKFKEKSEKRREQSNAFQNQIISGVADKVLSGDALSEAELASITGTIGGAETVRTLQFVSQNKRVHDYNINAGVEPITMTNEQYKEFYSIKQRIRDGHYSTLGELGNEIFELTSTAQMELVGDFVNGIKYKENVAKLKEKGVDIEAEIKAQFSALFGATEKQLPGTFDYFKRLVVDDLRGKEMSGKKIDYEMVKVASHDVRSFIATENTYEQQIARVIESYEKAVASEEKGSKRIDYTSRMEKMKTAIEDSNFDDLWREEDMEKFAQLLMNGNIDAAHLFVKEQNEASLAYQNSNKNRRRLQLADALIPDFLFGTKKVIKHYLK